MCKQGAECLGDSNNYRSILQRISGTNESQSELLVFSMFVLRRLVCLVFVFRRILVSVRSFFVFRGSLGSGPIGPPPLGGLYFLKEFLSLSEIVLASCQSNLHYNCSVVVVVAVAIVVAVVFLLAIVVGIFIEIVNCSLYVSG